MQTQYSVLHYRIDLYFHDHKHTIKIDESGNTHLPTRHATSWTILICLHDVPTCTSIKPTNCSNITTGTSVKLPISKSIRDVTTET